ncbi:2-succinylbenzoate--CoA ligase [Streptomyces violarus]
MSAGELEVRGPWIAGAYYNGTDAEALRPADKFSEDGWLKTGDVGTISPDGFLTLTDRAKDVIKSGGEWISSVELENALMAHPDVAEAAVVAVPDDKWGERPLAAGRPQGGRHRRLHHAARLPPGGAEDRQVAAAGALDGDRGGAESQRGQVRQKGAAPAVRRGHAGRHPDLTPAYAAGEPDLIRLRPAYATACRCAVRRNTKSPSPPGCSGHRRTAVLPQPSASQTAATADTPPQPKWVKAGPARAEAVAPPAKPETT